MFSWARRLLGAVADATPFVACMNRHGKNARGCAVGGSTMVLGRHGFARSYILRDRSINMRRVVLFGLPVFSQLMQPPHF